MSINPRNFIIVVIGNMAAQYLTVRYLRTANIVPDFNLLLIIYASLSLSAVVALPTAFTLGFYQDFILRSPMGGHSIIYVGLAYLVSRLLAGKITLSRKNVFLLVALLTFLFTVLYQAALTPAWSRTIFLKPLMFAVLNAMLSIPAFALYRRGLN